MNIKITPEGSKEIKSHVKFDSITMDFPNNRVELRLGEAIVGVIQIYAQRADTITVGGIEGKFEVKGLTIL